MASTDLGFGQENTNFSLTPMHKLCPQTLSVLSLSTMQVPGLPGCLHGPLSFLGALYQLRQNLKADCEPTGESLGLARTELWEGRGSCPLSVEMRPSIQAGVGVG